MNPPDANPDRLGGPQPQAQPAGADWQAVLDRFEAALDAGGEFEAPDAERLGPPPPAVHQRIAELLQRSRAREAELEAERERVGAELAEVQRIRARRPGGTQPDATVRGPGGFSGSL